jgi:hypothetical protein
VFNCSFATFSAAPPALIISAVFSFIFSVLLAIVTATSAFCLPNNSVASPN